MTRKFRFFKTWSFLVIRLAKSKKQVVLRIANCAWGKRLNCFALRSLKDVLKVNELVTGSNGF
jgi:hypothetical protein